MAITAATQMSDFSGFIDPVRAAPIFERAARVSVAMALIRQVPLGITSTTIPVVTGRPSAGWVSEGQQKPASSGSMSLVNMEPKKLAAIMVFSQEVIRANPANFVDIMRASLAESFAVAFDRAVFHDEGPNGEAGGGPFATNFDTTTKAVALGTNNQAAGAVYADLVSAMSQLVASTDASNRRYRLTGWALDDVVEPVLLAGVDTSGRPIWAEMPFEDTVLRAGRLIGRPAYFGEGIASLNLTDVVGYAGDFSQAAWGVIGGINFAVSTETTVTINGSLVSLFENNLVAIRAEAEYGFVLNDANAFVKITNTDNSPVTSV